MKKLLTTALFVSGLMLFACEDPAEELFQEAEKAEQIADNNDRASHELDVDMEANRASHELDVDMEAN